MSDQSEKDCKEYYEQIEKLQGGGPMICATMRDYFAAKAMACAFNNEFDVMDCGDYHHQYELVAELAYAMADAMLAERAK